MKERPILFSGPMVRAILEGRKTQTRRVMKSQPYLNAISMSGGELVCHNDYLPPSTILMDVGRGKNSYTTSDVESDGFVYHCPYGAPGDLLWVRETWALSFAKGDPPFYRADLTDFDLAEEREVRNLAPRLAKEYREHRWRPSIHMPRWASRLTLKVTDVRVERLQEISEADAKAEGWPPGNAVDALTWYSVLWRDINGAESWVTNPWVWVVSFERHP